MGASLAYALNRRGRDEDQAHSDRREWERGIEVQLTALDDKVDALRERAAEHTALLRYFLPWPDPTGHRARPASVPPRGGPGPN